MMYIKDNNVSSFTRASKAPQLSMTSHFCRSTNESTYHFDGHYLRQCCLGTDLLQVVEKVWHGECYLFQ